MTIFIRKIFFIIFVCMTAKKKNKRKMQSLLCFHSVNIALTRNATAFRCCKSTWFVSIFPSNEMCVVMQNLYSSWILHSQNYYFFFCELAPLFFFFFTFVNSTRSSSWQSCLPFGKKQKQKNKKTELNISVWF